MPPNKNLKEGVFSTTGKDRMYRGRTYLLQWASHLERPDQKGGEIASEKRERVGGGCCSTPRGGPIIDISGVCWYNCRLDRSGDGALRLGRKLRGNRGEGGRSPNRDKKNKA